MVIKYFEGIYINELILFFTNKPLEMTFNHSYLFFSLIEKLFILTMFYITVIELNNTNYNYTIYRYSST